MNKCFFWVSAISLILSFTNCTTTNESNEPADDSKLVSKVPNEQIQRSFENKYGDIQNVNWSTQGNDYYIADFILDSLPATAWFDQEGEWVLGKVGTSSKDVESLVAKTLQQTDYSDWNIDNANILERKGLGKVYLLDVIQNNEKSKLYFTRYGDFIKAISDAGHIDMPVNIPDQLHQTINQLFNNPEIVDITEHDEWMTEINVGILDNSAYKIAALDSSYEWLSTFWDLDKNTVPAIVWEGFLSSEYVQYELIAIKAMQDADKLSYIFYVEDSEKKEYILSFDTNGVLHSVIS